MGLSIHYSGRFKPEASLAEMVEEVRDIAETHKWKYTIFEKKFPEGAFGQPGYDRELYGITFSPPGCEPVDLCFLSNCRMSGPVNFSLYGGSTSSKEKDYLYMLSTKTQFAGIQIHKIVVLLLKYISEKYLEDFVLSDEGRFWETGDEKVLEENFKRYTFLLNNFSEGLQNYPLLEGDTIEGYLERLIKKIHKKGKL